jgi:hypothetical protein
VSPMAISWIVFGCVFGGALVGMLIHRIVPQDHLGADSKDVMKLAMGVLATMSALVLALLISSAKISHDTQTNEVTQMAADFIQLDRVLAHWGPETKDARALLYTTVASGLGNAQSLSGQSQALDSAATDASANNFFEKIQQLQPHSDFQRALYGQEMQIGAELSRNRSMLLEQTAGSIPMPFLVVLIFWLSMLFAGFGLFSPSNATVIGVLFVCAISIAGAIFLILEMDRPFEGLIQISSAPLRNALAHLGK